MAKIHLNTQSAQALQQLIGHKSFIVPIGGDIVTGDKGDETIIVQYNYSDDGAEAAMLVIRPNSISTQHGCALTASGDQVVPECEGVLQPSDSGSTIPLDSAAVRAFIAAVSLSEIPVQHQGSLNVDKVAAFKAMLGVK